MKKEMKIKMQKEMDRLIDELTKVDPCSEDYKAIVSRVKDINEELNGDGEKMKSTIFNSLEVGVKATGVILPIMFYSVWMNRGLEFEKEGTFTSGTFKGLTKFFRPN